MRRVILALVQENALLNGRVTEALTKMGSLKSCDVSNIEGYVIYFCLKFDLTLRNIEFSPWILLIRTFRLTLGLAT